MFSDTHFHFKMMVQERGLNGSEILKLMAQRDCFFGLDIGTRCEDLLERVKVTREEINKIDDKILCERASSFIKYSAGIWPDIGEIKDRQNAIKKLEETIVLAGEQGIKISAIGEGGLDHHWNPSGADGRCEDDFDEEIYLGERELFMMQLKLAQKLNLPMIVHSRDAFSDTYECIRECGYNNGIIHCYSYGIEEARAFLDLGWYIAFGGGVTYTKKSKMEDMLALLKFVPKERLLLETDAPYLAPVPHRGESNTPVYIEHVYDFISQARGVFKEELSATVDENIKKLFRL